MSSKNYDLTTVHRYQNAKDQNITHDSCLSHAVSVVLCSSMWDKHRCSYFMASVIFRVGYSLGITIYWSRDWNMGSIVDTNKHMDLSQFELVTD